MFSVMFTFYVVLSKATGQTLQKHYDCDYDGKNKIHAPSLNHVDDKWKKIIQLGKKSWTNMTFH